MSTDDREPVLAQAVAGRLMAGGAAHGRNARADRHPVGLPAPGRPAGLGISNKAAKLSERAHRQLDPQWISPQRLLNAAIKPLAVRVEIPLTQVQAVTPTRRCGLLVTWIDAGKPRRAEFAVAASRFSPAWNPENATARDSFLAQITSRPPKS